MRKLLSSLTACLLPVCGIALSYAQSSTLSFSTLAGTAGTIINSAEGAGSAAQFSSPRGVTVDSSGNVFVADASNNTVRKVTALGVVTTLAGSAGSEGRTDATGSAARFTSPYSVAVDGSGNLYIADTFNHIIRKITSAGVVTTLAGASALGSADGIGTAAQFYQPRGISVDSSGNVYVADYGNNAIRKITPTGVVTTLAGAAGTQGSTDGSGTAARFKDPMGVAADSAGNVYVADTANRTVRKISTAGTVTTLAGTAGTSGSTDGSGAAARFNEPRGVAVDATGTLYVTDFGSHTLRKVSADGVVTTLAGSALVPGTTDASGTAARFYSPSGVSVDSNGNVYVADTANNTIRKVTSGGIVTTLAGLAGRSSSVNGTGAAARFEDPYAIATDTSGNIYVADASDHSVRKITGAGVVTTLAGTAGSFGSTDASGSAARFFGPLGIAADSSGNVYLADTGNHIIRKISSAGVVTTLAGSAGIIGITDGNGALARFSGPNGVAVDSTGNVYVADTNSSTIRKITAAGVVTTLAGSPGSVGLTNGTGTAARFSVPFDVAVDSAGNVYVSDHGNHAIRKITPDGVVTTLAGSGSAGNSDGSGTAASFKFPTGVAVDSAGNVFVADTDNQVIRQITPAGAVTTVAGKGSAGSTDGLGAAAAFFDPKDVAVDSSGNLFVADRGNHAIRKGVVTTTTLAPVTLNFVPGFSLVGNSSSGVINVAEATMFGDQTKAVTVWKWLAATGKWAFYAPSLSASALSDYAASKGFAVLSTISGSEGFWVDAKSTFSVQLPAGTPVSSESFRSMVTGFNLISTGDNKTPSQFNVLLSATPPATGTVPLTNLTTLWAWDAAQGKWYFYAPSLEAKGGTALTDYITSKTYLDFTASSKLLAPGVGFWVDKP